MEKILALLQQSGDFIHRINETLYFYININTKVPWLVIILLAVLGKLVSVLLKDNKLDSSELVILLGIYLTILGAITASYMNLENIRARAHPEYAFFMVVMAGLTIVVGIAFLGIVPDKNIRKASITGALFLPIILLVLTNGEILEKRTDTLKALLPRSNSTIIGLTGEIGRLYVGGSISSKRRDKIESLLKQYHHIKDAAVVCRKDNDKDNGDGDGYIKPFAFVVATSRSYSQPGYGKRIINYMKVQAKKGLISPYECPRWIKFVEKIPKGSDKKPNHNLIQKKAQNFSDLYSGSPNDNL